jgi:SAM-dependent methyltransferase
VNERNKHYTGPTTEYNNWLRQRHGGAHARRTAERNAAFFLPFLKPGMKLLDAGSGPGSITIGLAGRVAGDGGEVVGIDISPESIEAAHALASDRGVTNARFETADVYELPFEDATFDAAFSHAMLQHLADPLAALREVRRVLKPNAVIGLADADRWGSLLHPMTPALQRALDFSIELRLHDAGTPDAGRRLRELLSSAGFTRNAASVAAGCEGSNEAVAVTAAFEANNLEAPQFIAHVESTGLATAADLHEMADAWRAWGAAPGAVWMRFWCQAVGWADAS